MVKMATITLSVPDELKNEMEKSDMINWSSVARHAFIETLEEIERLNMLKRFKQIVSKSEFSEKDANFFSEKVKKSMHNTLKKG
jgi:hypothetical protein